ncbi:MAG: hypothetical protein ACI90Q_000652, partial [Nonlabens sp.]
QPSLLYQLLLLLLTPFKIGRKRFHPVVSAKRELSSSIVKSFFTSN